MAFKLILQSVLVIFVLNSPQVLEINFNEFYNEQDIEVMAKVMYGEARGIDDVRHLEAVGWCILNRVDNSQWADNVTDVATQKHQFAYSSSHGTTTGHGFDLLEVAEYVLQQWVLEKYNFEVDRILPSEYVYFSGDGDYNYFRTTYKHKGTTYFEFP